MKIDPKPFSNEVLKVKNDFVSNNELLTIDEASGLLKLKKSRLRKAIFRREVKYVKLGALIRFKREHLEEWIERHTVGSAA